MPSSRLHKLLFLFFDGLCIITSVYLAYEIRFKSFGIFSGPHRPIDDIILWAVAIPVVFYILELYNRLGISNIVMRTFVGVMGSGFLLSIFSYLFYQFFIGRILFALEGISIAILTTAWRVGYNFFRGQIEKTVNIILLGPKDIVFGKYDDFIKETDRFSVKQYHYNSQYEGTITFDEIAKAENAVVVFVDDPNIPAEVIQGLVQLRLNGITVKEISDFYESMWGKLPVYHLRDRWFVYSRGFTAVHYDFYQRIKRLLDVGLSSIGLILTAPLMMFTATLIKIESKGSLFYKQERIGLNGKPFIMIKFRSMVQDAEKGIAVWARKGDPRVTRVGKIIRVLRIDELPQLFNILNGDMSFVGPRPERPIFVNELEKNIPYYTYRHLLKPGLTGWAQVNYPYGDSIEDAVRKLEFDLYYIKNASLFLDIQVIFKTIRVVLYREGSR
ncbi:MAG: exopolysaccharide biosynthesis polyprenyl glycosylphosphotransferase [Candidatus Omnitrophica bacterium]|nr:exopolysaccharide biosynthesis polyprenyl glycosylphosphotransferase [Candidatus Omnitrophota bacterium]